LTIAVEVRRTLLQVTLEHGKQVPWQRFGCSSKADQIDEAAGDLGTVAGSRVRLSTGATVLKLECDGIVDEALSTPRLPGLPAEETKVQEHPQHMLEDGHRPPVVGAAAHDAAGSAVTSGGANSWTDGR